MPRELSANWETPTSRHCGLSSGGPGAWPALTRGFHSPRTRAQMLLNVAHKGRAMLLGMVLFQSKSRVLKRNFACPDLWLTLSKRKMETVTLGTLWSLVPSVASSTGSAQRPDSGSWRLSPVRHSPQPRARSRGGLASRSRRHGISPEWESDSFMYVTGCCECPRLRSEA